MAQEVIAPTNVGLRICARLAKFRFMTPHQMALTGVNASERNLYNILRDLRTASKPLIGFKDFGVLPGEGRLPVVYYLTKLGAELLEEAGYSNVEYPKKVTMFRHDYFHRIACVNFHIAFDKWLHNDGAELGIWTTYYQATGGSSRAKSLAPHTTVHYKSGQLSADAILSFTPDDGIERLCYFELHRGHNDNRRLYRQIEQYTDAIRESALEQRFDYDKAARVLIVFETETDLEKFAANTPLQVPEQAAKRFYLSALPVLRKDFKNHWYVMPEIKGKPLEPRVLF